MDWRRHLYDASFRGVPFKVRDGQSPLGRRIVVHEYPLRDEPYAEDLGRKARQWGVEALLVGDDCLIAARHLRAALEAPGAGMLVHPFLGALPAVVLNAVEMFDFDREGRMVRFSLTFGPPGSNALPTVTTDTTAAARAAAAAAAAAAQAAFLANYSLTSTGRSWDLLTLTALAAKDLNALMLAVRRVAGTIDISKAYLTALTSRGDALIADIAGLAVLGKISSTRSRSATLVSSPSSLAAALVTVVQGFRDTTGGAAGFGLAGARSSRSADGVLTALGGTPFLALAAAMPSAGTASGGDVTFDAALPTSGTSVGQAVANRTALAALVRQVALTEAVRVATSASYDSATEALAVRDTLADQLDAEMMVSSAETNVALRSLRAALVEDISTRAADLPSVTTVTSTGVVPALVLASRLYDDPSRADEIVARNGLGRGGWCSGALSVLSS
jgi:prophage DNA circulation protein